MLTRCHELISCGIIVSSVHLGFTKFNISHELQFNFVDAGVESSGEA